MKKAFTVGLAAALIISGPVLADDEKSSEAKPITLTETQMDNVTAAGYGKDIIDAAAPFGQLIGPAKREGTAAHDNYAGGAKGFVCAHLGSC